MRITAFIVLGICITYTNCAEVKISNNRIKEITSKPRIVGGTIVTNRTEFPYQVSVRLRRGFRNKHHCGGSIIDNKHVLTAAHCVFDRNTEILFRSSKVLVVAGDLHLFTTSSHTETYKVEYIYPHPKYKTTRQLNDIAILRIKDTFQPWSATVNLVSLATRTPTDGSPCIVSGWGTVNEQDQKSSPDLRSVMVPVVNRDTCKRIYGRLLKSGMMCAGYTEGLKDACQGDSGGPLVCDNVLAGVVSWGIGCGRAGYVGVYTDVSSYSDWIAEQRARSSGSTQHTIPTSIFLLLLLNYYFKLYTKQNIRRYFCVYFIHRKSKCTLA